MKKKITEIKKACKSFRNHIIKVDRANEIVAVIERSKARPEDYFPDLTLTIYVTGKEL